MSDNRKFGLYPKPSATVAGQLIQIEYIKLPPDLESDSDVPDLHTAFQDCLPYYAAYICEKSIGNQKAKQANLDESEYHKKRLQSKLQKFSEEIRFKWSYPNMRP